MDDHPRGTAPPRSSWGARLRALPPDGTAKTLLVACAVAIVCATFVSTAAVLLRGRQRSNRAQERREGLERLIARLPGIEAIFARTGARDVETVIVDLASGRPVPSIDPATFDARAAASDPASSVAIPRDLDLAGLERRATSAPVYLVREGSTVALVVLPVEGSGYGGPIRGFVALSGDGGTVLSFSVYEHHETAGLGARIEEPAWRARFEGKRVRDAAGRLRIGVATERIDPADAPHLVDGISGASVTSEAVGNLLRYWLGDHGFGPFLRTLAGSPR